MRVLFVTKSTDFVDPLAVAYLSAAAKVHGHETFLSVMDKENTIRRIQELEPQVVAYSSGTGDHQGYFAFNRLVKQRFPHLFAIMGGPHPTFYASCVDEQPSIDAICVGEGEGAFVDLLMALERGDDISRIPNIQTRDAKNPMRPLVMDLDSLPIPDRDLLFSNTELGDFPLKSFFSSRGCPYPCTYCFEPVLKTMYRQVGSKRYLRRHSVDRVVEEISRIRAGYPLGLIKFHDDLFVLQADDWLEEFARRYPREVGLPFTCLTRVDCIDDDTVGLLRKAGCVAVQLSVDSANYDIRRRFIKKLFTNEDVIRAFELIHSYGIKVMNNIILGMPHSTIDDDKGAVELNTQCRTDCSTYTILLPYPGTEIWNYCVENNLYDGHVDSVGESFQRKSPLNCFSEEQKDIQRNILYLGALASWQPWTQSLILNHLIYWKPNLVFMLVGSLVRLYLMKTRIYPMPMDWRRVLRNLLKAVRIEIRESMPEMGQREMYPQPTSTVPWAAMIDSSFAGEGERPSGPGRRLQRWLGQKKRALRDRLA